MYGVLRVFVHVGLAVSAMSNAQSSYHGILINGQAGTQIYDPFNTSDIHGNLQLGLQKVDVGSAAVSNGGHVAYFGSENGQLFLHQSSFHSRYT